MKASRDELLGAALGHLSRALNTMQEHYGASSPDDDGDHRGGCPADETLESAGLDLCMAEVFLQRAKVIALPPETPMRRLVHKR